MNRMALLMATIAATFAHTTTTAQDVDLAATSEKIVARTNRFRNDHELPSLSRSDLLQQTAQKFADYMARTETYGHHADDRTPAERAEASGYEYCVVRENIAYRRDSRDLDASMLAEFFAEGWIESPGHRENMLAEYVTETGVAVATTDGLTYYAVQLFGRPKSMAYKVSVMNTSETTWTLQIESNGGSDEMEIPPRGSLRMKRCFPVTLSIAGTKTKKQLKDSAELQISSDSEGTPVFE